jgi:predicted component of type VI protein secretion system
VIQFQILSGKSAGSDIAVRCFPFLIGRGADAQFRLDDAGVWERHFEINFQRKTGFTFTAQSEALTMLNSEPSANGTLKNGDWIELGSVRLRFWLARKVQKNARTREVFTWISLFLLFAVQAGLIYSLMR